jgi:hypothetical protein
MSTMPQAPQEHLTDEREAFEAWASTCSLLGPIGAATRDMRMSRYEAAREAWQARAALATHPAPSAAPAQPTEPLFWISERQIPAHLDGKAYYMPYRTKPEGLFQFPLYAAPPENDRLRAALAEAVEAIGSHWSPYERLSKRQAAALAAMEAALRGGAIYSCANAFTQNPGRCAHWCCDERTCPKHPKPEHAHSSGVRAMDGSPKGRDEDSAPQARQPGAKHAPNTTMGSPPEAQPTPYQPTKEN